MMANAFDLGLSPLRVEVRQLQFAVARRGYALRLHLRRIVSPGHRQQGPQSRHLVVRDHRSRLAWRPQGCLCTLARRRQLRRERCAETPAVGADGALRAREEVRRWRRRIRTTAAPAIRRPDSTSVVFSSDSNGCLINCRRSAFHSLAASRSAREPAVAASVSLAAVPSRQTLRTTFGRPIASSVATAALAPAPNKSTCRKRMESRKSPTASA